MNHAPYPLTLPNCRTVGGMSAGSSKIRSSVLFRCAVPAQLDEQISSWVDESRISKIFDLRSDFEAQRLAGFPEIAGMATRTRLPLLEGNFTGSSRIQDLDSLYLPLLLNHPTTWVQVTKEVANNETATLIHCTAGKDRTGVAVALLLLAVGADRDAVFEDYAASTANLKGPWLETMKTKIGAAGIPVTDQMIDLLVGTSVPGLDMALREVEHRHGSVADYLLAHGLRPEHLEQLGERLLV